MIRISRASHRVLLECKVCVNFIFVMALACSLHGTSVSAREGWTVSVSYNARDYLETNKNFDYQNNGVNYWNEEFVPSNAVSANAYYYEDNEKGAECHNLNEIFAEIVFGDGSTNVVGGSEWRGNFNLYIKKDIDGNWIPYQQSFSMYSYYMNLDGEKQRSVFATPYERKPDSTSEIKFFNIECVNGNYLRINVNFFGHMRSSFSRDSHAVNVAISADYEIVPLARY